MNILGAIRRRVAPQDQQPYRAPPTQKEFNDLVMRIIKTATTDVSAAETAQALGTQIGAMVGFGHLPEAEMETMLAAAHKTVDDFARDTMANLPDRTGGLS